MDSAALLDKAQKGDIRAFHTLFSEFQPQLKSYLYRLLANRDDMEDLAQDVFILAFENVSGFRGDSNLKTWVFTIATNRARQHLKDHKRWATDTLTRTKEYAHSNPDVMGMVDHASRYAPAGIYEIREHIDYCFTCTSKMLVIEQQLALILKDVYGFKVKEAAVILEKSHGAVKHLLYNARKTMMQIFDDTCAFVSKQGICNQCSELNGRFNPKQDRRQEEMKIKLVRESKKHNRTALYKLRADLARGIDPLHASGTDLHEVFLRINHQVNMLPNTDG